MSVSIELKTPGLEEVWGSILPFQLSSFQSHLMTALLPESSVSTPTVVLTPLSKSAPQRRRQKSKKAMETLESRDGPGRRLPAASNFVTFFELFSLFSYFFQF